MAEPTFRLVFKGEYSLDCEIDEVKQKVSALFKLDREKVETLFSGKAITLKSKLSREEATRLKAVFDKTGGIAYVEQMAAVTAPIVEWASHSEEIPPQFQASLANAGPVTQEPFACPKCGFEQEETPSCAKCGVFFHKLTASYDDSRAEAGFQVASATSGPVMDEKEERKWAMACHLSALSGFVIPLGNVIGPLVVWITKKNESEFVNEHGKTALNFQLTLTIFIFCSLLISLFSSFLLIIILPVIAILAIYNLIMIITSGAKANNGEYVQIPMSSRIIK